MPVTSPTLSIHDLSLARGQRQLFAGLNFELSPQELIWLTGANGCGKSSFLRSVCGLLPPQSGSIELNGEDIYAKPSNFDGFNNHCIYLGHKDGHKADLSVEEITIFWADLYNGEQHDMLDEAVSVHDRIKTALQTVNLWQHKNKRAKYLSAGQAKRLSLARVLIAQAPIWLLDEPGAALDPVGVEILHTMIHSHLASGGCAVIASHAVPKKIGQYSRVINLSPAQHFAIQRKAALPPWDEPFYRGAVS